MSSTNHTQITNQIKRLIEANSSSEIRLNANGGNSILVIYEPLNEINILKDITQNLEKDKFEIIDLSLLLTDFVKEDSENLELMFDLLKRQVNQIFKAPVGEERPDFFEKIIDAVSTVYNSLKIPVLINTGVLYGTRIESINIMENEVVMKAANPLIILYPATQIKDNLAFLGKRYSSKYRCMVIS